jgi:hypothetical protein
MAKYYFKVHFHASVLGIAFGPVDTMFTGLGLLSVIGGIYARLSLRSMITFSS